MIILTENNSTDEAKSLLTLQEMKLDQETIVLHSGVEVLKFLKEKNEVQLLILSLDLPPGNSSDLMLEIRKNKSSERLSIIMLKSQIDSVQVIPVDQSPLCSQIFTKPLMPAHLTTALMHFLNYWINSNNNKG